MDNNERLMDETMGVYNTLGATYVDKIAGVKLPQLEEFMEMLPAGGRVLDVGCAAGRDSAILRDAGFQVVGIDYSEVFLDLARERVPGVDFIHADVRKFSFYQYPFDGIWAHAVLLNLHRSDIPVVLDNFKGLMCEPESILAIGVKEGTGEKRIGEKLVEGMKRRETYFGKNELEAMVRDSRFTVTKSYIQGDELGRSTTKWLYVFAKYSFYE